MSRPDSFGREIAELYERHFVPLIFEPYAVDLAARAVRCAPTRVLELAAGTGVVTRHLARSLPASTELIATDLSQAMLDTAAAMGTVRPVTWRQADAMQLPFDDQQFDLVICQFGVMFFPDKAKAFAEARRVLRPGGTWLFNVWDRLEENEFVAVIQGALDQMFPVDPSHFMERTPHGYFDQTVIATALRDGGFERAPAFTTVTARSRAESARVAAIAYCQGTPLRAELEARAPGRLEAMTEFVAGALAQRFGQGPVDGQIQAHVVSVQR